VGSTYYILSFEVGGLHHRSNNLLVFYEESSVT